MNQAIRLSSFTHNERKQYLRQFTRYLHSYSLLPVIQQSYKFDIGSRPVEQFIGFIPMAISCNLLPFGCPKKTKPESISIASW